MAVREKRGHKDASPTRLTGQGAVMPIGGAEKKEVFGGSILARFVELAGGKRARIAIIPTASEDAPGAAEKYIGVFSELGAKEADWLRVETREDANSDEAMSLLKQATGIFITGGDQTRLISLLAGTRVMECIRERNAQGVIVAGTSAGASILAAHMLGGGTGIGGNSNGATARKGMVDFIAGFGLMEDIIIDQHFSERGRLGRLLAAFAANPGLLAIGLDEDTAALIDGEGTLEVLGSEMVTIVDGRNTTSDYFRREPGEVLTIVNSSLHVLAAGRKFNLTTREPIPAEDDEGGA